jgi:hypothetical protein
MVGDMVAQDPTLKAQLAIEASELHMLKS